MQVCIMSIFQKINLSSAKYGAELASNFNNANARLLKTKIVKYPLADIVEEISISRTSEN